MSYASEDGLAVDEQHRPKDTSPSSIFGLVTKVIPPSDPKFKSDGGKRAIAEEVNDLLAEKVWRYETVREWSEVRHVRKDGFPPMVGLLFLIMGQKNAELAAGLAEDDPACPLRCRGVFQGSNVKTGDGTPAWMVYQEVGATPSSMATAQMAIAAGVLKGSRPTTRDAKKAYIQSWIDKPGRPRT